MLGSAPPSLHLDEVLPAVGAASGATVCSDRFATYLVMCTPGRSGPCWICAPASPRALACVRRGDCSPWAVVHHSATGTVTLFRTLLDGTVRVSVVLCAELPAGSAVLSAA